VDTDVESTTTTNEEEDKVRKSLQSLLKSNRYRVPMDGENTMLSILNQDYNDSDSEDDETHHFSTSTDLSRPTFNTRISVTESVVPPPSDRSVNTKGSRISLQEFMEERKSNVKNLGEISTKDSASVNSAMLTVSYDENCAQLVLDPSYDGSSRLSGGTLGASYPHPASVCSFDTTKKHVSCTPSWLDANIDMVWKQIDGVETDDDGLTCEDDERTYEEDETTLDGENATYNTGDEDEETHDGTLEGSAVESLTKPCKRSSEEDWEENALAVWSFSPENSVTKKFSNLISKEVIQPMLKPICHFVDATEIPEPSTTTMRDPLSESGANIRSL